MRQDSPDFLSPKGPVTGWKLLPGSGGITSIWVDLSKGQFLEGDAAESHQPPVLGGISPAYLKEFCGEAIWVGSHSLHHSGF